MDVGAGHRFVGNDFYWNPFHLDVLRLPWMYVCFVWFGFRKREDDAG